MQFSKHRAHILFLFSGLSREVVFFFLAGFFKQREGVSNFFRDKINVFVWSGNLGMDDT